MACRRQPFVPQFAKDTGYPAVAVVGRRHAVGVPGSPRERGGRDAGGPCSADEETEGANAGAACGGVAGDGKGIRPASQWDFSSGAV